MIIHRFVYQNQMIVNLRQFLLAGFCFCLKQVIKGLVIIIDQIIAIPEGVQKARLRIQTDSLISKADCLCQIRFHKHVCIGQIVHCCRMARLKHQPLLVILNCAKIAANASVAEGQLFVCRDIIWINVQKLAVIVDRLLMIALLGSGIALDQ